MTTQHNAHVNNRAELNNFSAWLMPLGIAVLYLLFGLMVHRYTIGNGIVSIFWPGSGLALAALLIGGKRFIWGILLGSLLFNALSSDSLWVVGGSTLANVLEALFGAWLLTRNCRSVLFLRTLPNYLRLIALGGVVASTVGAILGSLSLLLTGIVTTPADYFEIALHWWMGDVLGIVLITPLILAWWQPRSVPLTGKQRLEWLLLIGITFVAGQIIFLGWFHQYLSDTPKGYWMFLFVALVAMRLGSRGLTFVVLMIATQALSGAYQEVGFFAHDIVRAGLHNYWAYMLILSVVGMAMTTYVEEMEQGFEALQLKDSALNAAANGIIITDADGHIEWANQAFSRLTGFSFDEAYGRDTRELVKSGKHDNAFYESMWSTILANKIWHGEIINRRKDGSLYDEEMTITPLVNEQSEITHFVAVKQDITERKKVEEALKESESRWKFAIEGSGDGVWDWNIQTDEAKYSSRWKDILGYAEDDSMHTNQEWVDRIHPDDQPYVAGAMQAYLEGKTTTYVVEYRLRCKDDSYKWILSRGMLVSYSEDGKPLRMIGTYSDVTERKQIEEQVRQLAFYDTLTRLPNRRLLHDRLSQTMAASKRSGICGALMFLDLDNFKSLNDTQGHAVGDLLLIEAARRLKNCVREVDTVARFGGDEFVVMLNELEVDKAESTSQARIVAEKIRTSLAEPYLLTVSHEGKADTMVKHHCTASIGVVVFINHEGSQDDILKWADTAMYRAKAAGRNLIRFYDVKV